jgi:adenosylhomocysteine nucleosidase
VGGVLDFSAACAGEVAAEEGFQHENEGVSLFAGEFLPHHVGCDGPHLRDWNSHGIQSIPAGGGGLQWAIVKQRKWLVLTALAMEGKAIARALGGKTESEDVCVRVIGLGGVRLNRDPLDGFERIMLAGLGGALDPSLAIGDIVCEGMEEGPWPGLTVRVGKIYTADHLVDTFQEKERLFRETGCLAVEMEGLIVRRAVESTGATFVHIRAISDLAGQNGPKRMAGWIDEVGQPLVTRAIGDLIRHPTIAPSMIRLGMQSNAAVKRLGEIVRQVVGSPAGF